MPSLIDPFAATSYGLLLYPGFEVLDIAGPLEALNVMARRPQNPNDPNSPGSAMTLSIITATGEPVTPVTPSQRGSPFTGVQMYYPTHSVRNAPKLDVLIVPGGTGTNENQKDEIAFIQKRYPELKYLLTVCTGSGLAALAHVLDGGTATTNKQGWTYITPWGPETDWRARLRWVNWGKIWTTSGVSAGTDGALAWIAASFENGLALVNEICTTMEYNWINDPAENNFAATQWLQDVPPKNLSC